ncbi:hypothetical protein BU17DRAFT_102870 [Hysterangium stoloniferum]|nr:hypothetical protein BU17DRAFT_102870 [Hysterangium stoloniferum]
MYSTGRSGSTNQLELGFNAHITDQFYMVIQLSFFLHLIISDFGLTAPLFPNLRHSPNYPGYPAPVSDA